MTDISDMSDADRDLMARLAEAFGAEQPLPLEVAEAAKAVYTWRTIDAELAELVFDSATDALSGVRTASTDRQMTFESPALRIEVMVSTIDTRSLIGQLDPAGARKVELRQGDRVEETTPDELGRFMFTDVAVGPISLRCTMPDGAVVQTRWTVL